MGFRVRGVETQGFLPGRVCLLVTLLMGISHTQTKMRFGMFRGIAQRGFKRLFRLLPLFPLKMGNALIQIREDVAGFQARHLFPGCERGFPLSQSAQGNGLLEQSGRVFGISLQLLTGAYQRDNRRLRYFRRRFQKSIFGFYQG